MLDSDSIDLSHTPAAEYRSSNDRQLHACSQEELSRTLASSYVLEFDLAGRGHHLRRRSFRGIVTDNSCSSSVPSKGRLSRTSLPQMAMTLIFILS